MFGKKRIERDIELEELRRKLYTVQGAQQGQVGQEYYPQAQPVQPQQYTQPQPQPQPQEVVHRPIAQRVRQGLQSAAQPSPVYQDVSHLGTQDVQIQQSGFVQHPPASTAPVAPVVQEQEVEVDEQEEGESELDEFQGLIIAYLERMLKELQRLNVEPPKKKMGRPKKNKDDDDEGDPEFTLE